MHTITVNHNTQKDIMENITIYFEKTVKSENPYVCQSCLSHIGNYISSLIIVGFTLISLTGCYFDKAYLPSENRVYKHARRLAVFVFK